MAASLTIKKFIKLNSGHAMPMVGLGTWQASKSGVGAAVEAAIKDYEYRHIDCASIYHNEKEIGTIFQHLFKSKIIKRDELFVTSKLWNNEHDPRYVEAACRQTLRDLHLDYLDLYLVHWGIAFAHGKETEPLDRNGRIVTEPVPLQATWAALEKLVDKGLVRSIGVANFTTTMLLDLLTYARIKPAMNQIELHPYNAQTALVDFCNQEKIAVTAYSPLGSPGGLRKNDPVLLKDKTLAQIAKKHHKTTAQVLLRWGLQRGTIVIPKTENPKRLAENMALFDFGLTATEMKQINALDRRFRFVNPSGWWHIPYFD